MLVDTNILLRRIHRSHPQYRQARDAITSLNRRGDVLRVTAQNLIECWAVCTRPTENNGLGLLPDQAGRVLSRIENSVVRLSDDANTVCPEWRTLVASYGVSGKQSHDARLVATMKVHGVSHVLTYNTQDFRRYDGIVTIHPDDLEPSEMPNPQS
ncbi:MAG: PIN domain-containing protein [Bryobacteraceae bacterium]